jgi:raffinose/stachyose/melibiose transport system permease protein
MAGAQVQHGVEAGDNGVPARRGGQRTRQADQARRGDASERRRTSRLRPLTHLVLIAYSIFAVVPVVFIVLASVKSTPEFFGDPFGLPKPVAWSNYSAAWDQGGLLSAFRDSIVVTLGAVVVSTTVSGLAAYAVVRLRPRFPAALQLLFVIGLLVPAPVLVIPMFLLMKYLGLIGSIGSLVVPYIGLTIPLSFLIYVHFLRTVPASLGEAAQIDGASPWRVYWRIEFPLLKPATMNVIILNVVFVWNDFLLPLVLGTKNDLHTLPVAIVSFFGVYSTAYGLVFASVVMAVLPVVLIYVIFSRKFIEGITAGALK